MLFCEVPANLGLLLGPVRNRFVNWEKSLEKEESYGGNNCTKLHKIQKHNQSSSNQNFFYGR